MTARSVLGIVLYFCVLHGSMSAQVKTWSGAVVEGSTSSPLIGVNVFDPSLRLGTSTDRLGKFKLEFDQWPVRFEVSYLGFETVIIEAGAQSQLPDIIRLQPDATNLAEVVIRDVVVPQPVTEKSKSVSDFILVDNYLLYIETKGNAKDDILILSDTQGSILDVKKVSSYSYFEGLYRSCQGRPYVICEQEVFELDLSGDEIVHRFVSPRADFDAYVRPCQAKTTQYLYHGQFALKEQVAVITQVDLQTRAYHLLTKLYDKQSVDAYTRAIQLIEVYNQFAEYSRDAFFAAQIELEAKHLSLFTEKVQYDLFSVGDSVLIMDYANNQISYYNDDRLHLLDVPIYYNQHSNWTQTVLQDASTQHLYILIKDNGHLIINRLNVELGVLEFNAIVEIDFLHKAIVHNGELWYTTSRLTGTGIGKRLHRLEL